MGDSLGPAHGVLYTPTFGRRGPKPQLVAYWQSLRIAMKSIHPGVTVNESWCARFSDSQRNLRTGSMCKGRPWLALLTKVVSVTTLPERVGLTK